MMTSSRSRTARAAAGALAAAAVRRAGWGHASAPAAGGHTANMTTPRTGGAGCPRDCPPGSGSGQRPTARPRLGSRTAGAAGGAQSIDTCLSFVCPHRTAPKTYRGAQA